MDREPGAGLGHDPGSPASSGCRGSSPVSFWSPIKDQQRAPSASTNGSDIIQDVGRKRKGLLLYRAPKTTPTLLTRPYGM